MAILLGVTPNPSESDKVRHSTLASKNLTNMTRLRLFCLKQVRDFFGLWLVCDMSATCSKHVGDLVGNLVLSRF